MGTIVPRHEQEPASARRRLLLVMAVYTAFLVVLVPTYLVNYGPTNFLYFCDTALILGAISLWSGHPLAASAAAVGIIVPQTLWTCDFLAHFVGFRPLGMTDYMFDPGGSLFLRGLSLFHLWLPFLLVWILRRLGYDGRGFWLWTAWGTAVLLVSYFLLPPPPAPSDRPWLPVNVNLVFGFSDRGPQQVMPPPAYLFLLLVGMPLLCYLPTHLVLRRVFRRTTALTDRRGS